MASFGLKEKNILIEIFKINMKTKDKKIGKKKQKEEFHSVTEVEKEFLPVSTDEKKEQARIIDNIEKKTGSKLMLDILSSYLK